MNIPRNQATIGRSIRVDGIGLHGGRPARVVLHPAPVDSGIVIVLNGAAPFRVHAGAVERVPLCTRVVTPNGNVNTVEHLMAALRILSVDNIVVEIAGPELPILDGSAEPWAQAIAGAHVVRQSAARSVLEIVRPFSFRHGSASYSALPGASHFEVEIDFPQPVGRQDISFAFGDAAILLDARTFTFEAELDRLRAAGLGKGGSLDNAVVVGATGPLNPGGLRGEDEFVRHKALDLVGDLYIEGLQIAGRIHAVCPGHSANNAFLCAMMEQGVVRRVPSSNSETALFTEASNRALVAA